jgi:osmoprotectant transport system substrate-binding protein
MAPLSRRTLLATTAAAGLAILLSPIIARAAAPVRVGSKFDTEGGLLGNIILALLRAHKIPTVNRVSLGNTKIVRTALLSGEIDIYPEYTGNGAFFFNIDTDPVWKNAEAGYEKVKALDLAKNKIVWLAPAPANNTWGIAVNGDTAKQNKLATLDDFARWVNGGAKVRVAASAEFVESPLALPAFENAYGFKLSQDQTLVLAGGDTAATERAAADGTSGVNSTMAYGTDAGIAALDLVALEDTKHAQAVYEPAPILRQSVLEAYPQIKDILAPAFAALDGPTLRALNSKIAVDGGDPKTVATDWLQSKKLL